MVEEGGRILATRRFALPGDGQAATVSIPVPLPEAGARQLTVRLPGLPGEAVTRNNARETLVTVRDRDERILYYEGEPRFEFAFMRRAVAADTNLRVVGLERTAEGKFLRLGVEDSLDLAAGFPRTREELFKYRALSSSAASRPSAFTAEQLRMIAEFAGTRGGGLLLLGGRRAFGEGAWHDTPLEDVSPLLLDQPRDTGFFRVLAVQPSAAGRDHPVTQLAWDSLPPVTAVNRVGSFKPGAMALLSGRDTAGRGEQPVLAFQRYGRGRVMALPVQDTWHWQMAAQIAVDDQKYETFWRQLLRWLADESPDRLEVAAQVEDLAPGEPVTLDVELRDKTWQPVNDGAVTARVTDPAGVVTEVPLDWVIGADGRYRGAFTARTAGEYRIEATSVGADTLAAEPTFVRAGEVSREFFGAGAARAAAAPDRRGDRRQVLHDGHGVGASPRHRVHRARHHGDGAARSLGHADRVLPARRVAGRRVGTASRARDVMSSAIVVLLALALGRSAVDGVRRSADPPYPPIRRCASSSSPA